MSRRTSIAFVFVFIVFFSSAVKASVPWLSPNAVVSSRDGGTLFVSCATANRVLGVDVASGKVTRTMTLPASPTGLALSPDGQRLWVTCGSPEGLALAIDISRGRVVERIPTGHTPMAPVLSQDGGTLFVCNRFDGDVIVLDVRKGKGNELRRVKVQREPVAAALTGDGKYLLVANLLHNGRADGTNVAAVVSVIDTGRGTVTKELRLPNGSGSLNDVQVSPDGKYAVVTHILSRFHLPTTQLDRGWMNTNAKTIIDLQRMEVINTVLLDNADRGAANPWGAAWSGDSGTLVVAHAGTHEVSVINFPAVMARLAKVPKEAVPGQPMDYTSATRKQSDVPNDLAFLVGSQRRIRLPDQLKGPRAVVMIGTKAYVAAYFSDTLAVLDTAAERPQWQTIELGPKPVMTGARLGEFYFHDAGICFQGWQSCSSCHPGEARVDALNWDLLNDGIGNPKNNKSLLLTIQTPPAMSRAVRETGEDAIRAGIRHILFTVQPPAVGEALDAYIKGLKPVPSPLLDSGGLSKAARRGKKLFNDKTVGCASCHPAGLLTDLQSYDVGTAGRYDKPGDTFDTPTLVEAWRTAPYLHDGSAATLMDVLTTGNKGDEHGKTSHLDEQQLRDLAEYVGAL